MDVRFPVSACDKPSVGDLAPGAQPLGDRADRGQGLSLYLGARAVLHMHKHYGAAEFYTGVRSDNAVSRHVCTKLGVVQSDCMILAVLDPDLFGEGGYTK